MIVIKTHGYHWAYRHMNCECDLSVPFEYEKTRYLNAGVNRITAGQFAQIMKRMFNDHMVVEEHYA